MPNVNKSAIVKHNDQRREMNSVKHFDDPSDEDEAPSSTIISGIKKIDIFGQHQMNDSTAAFTAEKIGEDTQSERLPPPTARGSTRPAAAANTTASPTNNSPHRTLVANNSSESYAGGMIPALMANSTSVNSSRSIGGTSSSGGGGGGGMNALLLEALGGSNAVIASNNNNGTKQQSLAMHTNGGQFIHPSGRPQQQQQQPSSSSTFFNRTHTSAPTTNHSNTDNNSFDGAERPGSTIVMDVTGDGQSEGGGGGGERAEATAGGGGGVSHKLPNFTNTQMSNSSNAIINPAAAASTGRKASGPAGASGSGGGTSVLNPFTHQPHPSALLSNNSTQNQPNLANANDPASPFSPLTAASSPTQTQSPTANSTQQQQQTNLTMSSNTQPFSSMNTINNLSSFIPAAAAGGRAAALPTLFGIVGNNTYNRDNQQNTMTQSPSTTGTANTAFSVNHSGPPSSALVNSTNPPSSRDTTNTHVGSSVAGSSQLPVTVLTPSSSSSPHTPLTITTNNNSTSNVPLPHQAPVRIVAAQTVKAAAGNDKNSNNEGIGKDHDGLVTIDVDHDDDIANHVNSRGEDVAAFALPEEKDDVVNNNNSNNKTNLVGGRSRDGQTNQRDDIFSVAPSSSNQLVTNARLINKQQQKVSPNTATASNNTTRAAFSPSPPSVPAGGASTPPSPQRHLSSYTLQRNGINAVLESLNHDAAIMGIERVQTPVSDVDENDGKNEGAHNSGGGAMALKKVPQKEANNNGGESAINLVTVSGVIDVNSCVNFSASPLTRDGNGVRGEGNRKSSSGDGPLLSNPGTATLVGAGAGSILSANGRNSGKSSGGSGGLLADSASAVGRESGSDKFTSPAHKSHNINHRGSSTGSGSMLSNGTNAQQQRKKSDGPAAASSPPIPPFAAANNNVTSSLVMSSNDLNHPQQQQGAGAAAGVNNSPPNVNPRMSFALFNAAGGGAIEAGANIPLLMASSQAGGGGGGVGVGGGGGGFSGAIPLGAAPQYASFSSAAGGQVVYPFRVAAQQYSGGGGVNVLQRFQNNGNSMMMSQNGGLSNNGNAMMMAPSALHAAAQGNWKWRATCKLGSGAYGTVYLGFSEELGVSVANKTIDLSKYPSDRRAEVIKGIVNEIRLMRRLNHPNIVSYIRSNTSNKTTINIFMEYIPGGSLRQILETLGGFSSALVAKYVRFMLEGIAYLHSQGIIHRDIKAANVLVTLNGEVKLADFGSAQTLQQASGFAGTVNWMPPEAVLNRPDVKVTDKVDIWSLGCTVMEMFTGKFPFCEQQLGAIVENKQLAIFNFLKTAKEPLPIPRTITDPLARQFIAACLCVDPSRRPSAEELKQHPFILAYTQNGGVGVGSGVLAGGGAAAPATPSISPSGYNLMNHYNNTVVHVREAGTHNSGVGGVLMMDADNVSISPSMLSDSRPETRMSMMAPSVAPSTMSTFGTILQGMQHDHDAEVHVDAVRQHLRRIIAGPSGLPFSPSTSAAGRFARLQSNGGGGGGGGGSSLFNNNTNNTNSSNNNSSSNLGVGGTPSTAIIGSVQDGPLNTYNSAMVSLPSMVSNAPLSGGGAGAVGNASGGGKFFMTNPSPPKVVKASSHTVSRSSGAIGEEQQQNTNSTGSTTATTINIGVGSIGGGTDSDNVVQQPLNPLNPPAVHPLWNNTTQSIVNRNREEANQANDGGSAAAFNYPAPPSIVGSMGGGLRFPTHPSFPMYNVTAGGGGGGTVSSPQKGTNPLASPPLTIGGAATVNSTNVSGGTIQTTSSGSTTSAGGLILSPSAGGGGGGGGPASQVPANPLLAPIIKGEGGSGSNHAQGGAIPKPSAVGIARAPSPTFTNATIISRFTINAQNFNDPEADELLAAIDRLHRAAGTNRNTNNNATMAGGGGSTNRGGGGGNKFASSNNTNFSNSSGMVDGINASNGGRIVEGFAKATAFTAGTTTSQPRGIMSDADDVDESDVEYAYVGTSPSARGAIASPTSPANNSNRNNNAAVTNTAADEEDEYVRDILGEYGGGMSPNSGNKPSLRARVLRKTHLPQQPQSQQQTIAAVAGGTGSPQRVFPRSAGLFGGDASNNNNNTNNTTMLMFDDDLPSEVDVSDDEDENEYFSEDANAAARSIAMGIMGVSGNGGGVGLGGNAIVDVSGGGGGDDDASALLTRVGPRNLKAADFIHINNNNNESGDASAHGYEYESATATPNRNTAGGSKIGGGGGGKGGVCPFAVSQRPVTKKRIIQIVIIAIVIVIIGAAIGLAIGLVR